MSFILAVTLLLPTLASALVVTSAGRASSWAAQRASVIAAAEALPEETLQAKLAALRQKKGKRRAPSPIRTREAAPEAAPQVVDAVSSLPTAALASEAVLTGTQVPAWLQEVRADGLANLDRLRAMVRERDDGSMKLDAKALAAATEFMNTYFGAGLLAWTLAHTDVGKTAAQKNAWSRGSWTPISAELDRPLEMSSSGGGRVVSLHLRVRVRERGKQQPLEVFTSLALPTNQIETVDELRSALLRLQEETTGEFGSAYAGGVLLHLPGATDDWSLPDDLWLNTTPYSRSLRNMFYTDVSQAVQRAVADPTCPRRMKLLVAPPELNMEMDTYRVGSLLELVREVALGLAEQGLTCRICVQGSMGEGIFMGVPRVLSGVRKLLTMMDWQAGEGEEMEGVVGNVQEPAAKRVVEGLTRFGAVGAEEVQPDDDVLLILAPQSMVGASIVAPLQPMVEKATAQGSAVILLNPLLADRQSSSGVMSVRGRGERIAFAESFEEIYHFRTLYSGTTFMYPILGAVRMARPMWIEASAPTPSTYVLFQRRESGGAETYEPVGTFPSREPTVDEITELIPQSVEPIRGMEPRGDAASAASVSATSVGGVAPTTAPTSATDKFEPPTW